MHRILAGDGDHHCYACGVTVECVSDGDTDGAFASVPCHPGGWDHPPYLIPQPSGTHASDGPPLVETCAAHPYADCEVYPVPS